MKKGDGFPPPFQAIRAMKPAQPAFMLFETLLNVVVN